MKGVFLFISIAAILFGQCAGRGNFNHVSNRSNNKVKVEVNQLEVEFKITDQVIETTDQFQAQAIFTNKSRSDVRLNALFLEFAPILIKIRTTDGKLINPGSPPFPPEDDGKVGRIVMAPEQSETFEYRGVDYFGEPLPEGHYQAQFIYQNTITEYGDWTGKIESGWIDFEIRAARD